jgi:hypothetical protein
MDRQRSQIHRQLPYSFQAVIADCVKRRDLPDSSARGMMKLGRSKVAINSKLKEEPLYWSSKMPQKFPPKYPSVRGIIVPNSERRQSVFYAGLYEIGS